MTWIRCSDRMPMGEACIAAFRRRDGHDNGVERYMESANAESLREGYEEVCGQSPDWIDRTEWREVEPFSAAEELPRVEARPDGKMDVTFSARLPVTPDDGWAVIDKTEPKPMTHEEALRIVENAREFREVLRDIERSREGAEEETLRAAMNHHGIREQLAMLQEECGELVAAVSRWRRSRMGAFPALLEEIADVEILIDQMRLEFGAEIDQARAKKVARLRERLGR